MTQVAYNSTKKPSPYKNEDAIVQCTSLAAVQHLEKIEKYVDVLATLKGYPEAKVDH